MKKLILTAAVFAGASAFAAVGTSPYIYVGFDMGVESNWPKVDDQGNPITWWNILSHTGQTINWTMSADMTKEVRYWSAADWSGQQKSVGIVDFGGHTFTHSGAGDITASAFSSYGSSGTHCTFEMKNGVYSGGAQTPNLLIGWERSDASFENGTFKMTDLVLTNFNGIYLGRACQDVDLQFKNVEMTARNIAISDVNHRDESGLTLTFTDCVLNWTGDNALTDNGNGLSSLDINLLRKITFAGSKSYIHPCVRASDGARLSFYIGYQIPYGEITFEDGAVLEPEGALFMGYSKTAKGWTATFDNATVNVTHDAIYMGRGAGKQTMIFKNGTKVNTLAIGVGQSAEGSSDNTLIVSNADLSACGGIFIGGWYPGGGISYRNKAYFCGQNTKFREAFPLETACFCGADGLAVFDDVTLDKPNAVGYFFPVNPNDAEGTQAWENNEILFCNGTYVNLAAFCLGQFESTGISCDRQKLTFGNGVKANFTFFMNSGVGDTITVSNATVTTGTGQFYVGYNDPNTKHASGDNVFVFAGDHPKVRTTDNENGTFFLWNNTTVRFILPEGGSYAETPVIFRGIWCGGGVREKEDGSGKEFATLDDFATRFEFPNIEQVRETIIGTKEIELMRGESYITLSDYELSRAYISDEDPLPEGCSLSKRKNEDNSTSLILTIKGSGSAKPGAILIIK